MTNKQKKDIVRIGKEFASGFEDTFPSINGSGWLIVDPLSGYLNTGEYKNTLSQIPANDKHPLVLIMEFEDGSKLIPAGEDLKPIIPSASNWMWV